MSRSSCHDNLILVSMTSLIIGFVGAPGNMVRSGGGWIGWEGLSGVAEIQINSDVRNSLIKNRLYKVQRRWLVSSIFEFS